MKATSKKSHMHPIFILLLCLVLASFMGLFFKASHLKSIKVYEGNLHQLQTGSAFLSSEEVPILTFTTDSNMAWTCPSDVKKWSIFFFGYAQCPAFCPEILEQMDRVGRSLPQGIVDFYFVSIDPENDTPAALHQFLAQYHTSIIGLTGNIENIHALAQFFKLHVERASGQDEHIEHAATLALMSPEGYACGLFRDLNVPSRVAEDLLQITGSIEFVHGAPQ